MTANSEKKPRGPGKPFQKGIGGNPRGRPKLTAEALDLIAACKAKAPEALAVMEQIMMNGENERNRLAAAQAIIERGYGKAVQPLDIDATITTHEASLDDLA
jgi:hypothetical protein